MERPLQKGFRALLSPVGSLITDISDYFNHLHSSAQRVTRSRRQSFWLCLKLKRQLFVKIDFPNQPSSQVGMSLSGWKCPPPGGLPWQRLSAEEREGILKRDSKLLRPLPATGPHWVLLWEPDISGLGDKRPGGKLQGSKDTQEASPQPQERACSVFIRLCWFSSILPLSSGLKGKHFKADLFLTEKDWMQVKEEAAGSIKIKKIETVEGLKTGIGFW